MPYIGQQPTNVAFLTDQFSGNGSTTAFTLSAAPANTSSILVAISGVLQDPSTYSVSGTTLTFSPAPPTGTGNISVRFLGIPASGVTTTAYRTVTEFTATAGQTTFSVPSYTVGFIDVYRNGVLLGSADYTATSGVSVVLVNGCTVGDLVEVISFQVSSVLNAIPASPSSVGTTNLVDGSVTTAKIANSNVTMSKLDTQAQYTGFKNRLINGQMQIDQRNAGASVTPTITQYTVDRFYGVPTQASKFSVQQNAGSVTPPAGFKNYLGVTSLSAYSVLTGDTFYIGQSIEGFNVSDLGFGTANAQPVTISFWVRSSLTGTFGGSLSNATGRSYPFSYTISTANTWEQKSVTIPGDTSGTWLTNNGIGLAVWFGLGSGSTFSGTAGAWASSVLVQPTGSVSVVGTNGATFYITGVQLEKGSTATSFDYRPYSTELALCQRYLPAFDGIANQWAGQAFSTTQTVIPLVFPVTARTAPTGVTISSPTHFAVLTAVGGNVATTGVSLYSTGTSSGALFFTVASGLTAGNAVIGFANSTSARILFNGCEL